jgi:proteasome alpha subunit
VTGRALANAYAQTLGAIFTDQTKPFEVEICVAEVGAAPAGDELYKNMYDGSVQHEPSGLLAMGGQADAIVENIRSDHRTDEPLATALRLAVRGLSSVGGEAGSSRTVAANQLEVALLDRRRTGRTFRRITGAALTALLEQPSGESAEPQPAEPQPAEPPAAAEKPTAAKPAPEKPTAAKPAPKEKNEGSDTEPGAADQT